MELWYEKRGGWLGPPPYLRTCRPGDKIRTTQKRPEQSARVVCPDGRQGSGTGSSIVLLPSFALSSNKISVSDVLGFSFFTESVK